MAKKKRSLFPDVKVIPDYPDSPLPGWKHYGILKVLEGALHDELRRKQYNGHLVGLEVTYTTAEKKYTMAFGYNFENPSEPGDSTEDPLADAEDPLDDSFVEAMYDYTADLISSNIRPDVGHYDVHFSVSVNPTVTTKEVTCMIATQANCGQNGCIGKCRKFTKKNNEPWKCSHQQGRCTC